MSGFVVGKLSMRREWAPGLITLGVEVPPVTFAPGQFLNIGLEVGSELVRRAYSVASAPGAPLEFYLNHVDTGALTPSLFRLGIGDELFVEAKPQGFFTLDWLPKARELWMIATGTGLAPFISMLRSGEPLRRFSRVVLVHGVRTGHELAYADELEALALDTGRAFVRVPLVSRGAAVPGALSGRITTALDSGALEATAALALSTEASHVMLCGNPHMIDDMSERLAARGLQRHRVRKPGHITIERYWD